MVEAVKLMAGICLVPPEGHERALEAITTSGELKSISRFQPIIEALSNMENDTLTVSKTGRKPNLAYLSTDDSNVITHALLQIIHNQNFSFENTIKVACVQLINTIVLTPDDLDFRLHLRNEFMRVGLADLIDVRKTLKRQTTHIGNLIIS